MIANSSTDMAWHLKKDLSPCVARLNLKIVNSSLSSIPRPHHTDNSLNVNSSSLPSFFLASGGLTFPFWDYFQLVARCIAYACAWRSDTITRSCLIWPNWSQEWLTLNLLAVNIGRQAHDGLKKRSLSKLEPCWAMHIFEVDDYFIDNQFFH